MMTSEEKKDEVFEDPRRCDHRSRLLSAHRLARSSGDVMKEKLSSEELAGIYLPENGDIGEPDVYRKWENVLYTAQRHAADIERLIAVAHEHGWNGIENPKALWDFFEGRLSGQVKPNLEPEADAIVSAMAGSLLAMMDEKPNVVNFLGLELVEKGGQERRIQVTLQYVKPGVKTPEQRAAELSVENERLRVENEALRSNANISPELLAQLQELPNNMARLVRDAINKTSRTE